MIHVFLIFILSHPLRYRRVPQLLLSVYMMALFLFGGVIRLFVGTHSCVAFLRVFRLFDTIIIHRRHWRWSCSRIPVSWCTIFAACAQTPFAAADYLSYKYKYVGMTLPVLLDFSTRTYEYQVTLASTIECFWFRSGNMSVKYQIRRVYQVAQFHF